MSNQAYSLGLGSVGEDVTIWPLAKLTGTERITIGNSVIIDDFSGLSGGVRIYTGNEDYGGRCLTNPTVPHPYRQPVRSFVRIGRHAIVGANSIILPGVEIGEGAVVGANSLVTKSCKPWTVYFGSPAKELKRRKSATILELEQQLRREMFDAQGHYIPLCRRSGE